MAGTGKCSAPIRSRLPARVDAEPIVWDMATSAISLMEIKVAAEAGEAIPPNAAVDKHGFDLEAFITFTAHQQKRQALA